MDMGGLSAMTTRVNDSVFGTNVAFWNSRIPVSLKLVYSGQVSYHETGSLETDLNRLTGTKDGYMDNIHGLRNQYKADLVSLCEYDGDAGGLGWVLQNVGASGNSKYGFNVVLAYQAAGPSWSLAHELGHNLGLYPSHSLECGLRAIRMAGVSWPVERSITTSCLTIPGRRFSISPTRA
jgi:hypothetical protein